MKKTLILLFTGCAIASAEPNGAEIFKQCSICHGDQAQKRSLDVSAIIAGMDAKEIVKTLKAYQAGEKNQYGFGRMMQGQATKLSEAEMQAVANYIASLPPIKSVEALQTSPSKNKSTSADLTYNRFIQDYFKANPGTTFAEAKKKWDENQTQPKDESNH